MSGHRPIPGYPGYEVSADGQVFSVATNWRGYGTRELVQDLNSYGYPSVRLLVGNRRKRVPVHRLVAAAFLPPRPSSRHQIRHLDGTRTNNSHSNLRWGTAQDNADDREKHGRTHRGFPAHNRKLTTENMLRARQEYTDSNSGIRPLAARYGVSYSTMRAALGGLTLVRV